MSDLLISLGHGRSLLILVVILMAVGCSEGGSGLGTSIESTTGPGIDAEGSITSTVVVSATVETSSSVTGNTGETAIVGTTEGGDSSVSLILLGLALIASASLNLLVIRWLWWGRKYHATPSSVPDLLLGSVADHHKDLKANFKSLSSVIEAATKIQLEITESNNNTTENLSSSFQVLRSALDDRDQEIKRLKEGYDLAIFRGFVTRFVRIDLALIDELSDTDDAGQLSDFRELLLDALDECGVTPFSPEIGAEYRSTNGVADNPVFEQTDDSHQDGKISRVVRNGYLLENSETREVVIPAKVAVFVHKKLEA